MEANEMMDAIETELKRVEFHYVRKKQDGDRPDMIDTDYTSRSGVVKYYEVRFIPRNHGVQVLYFLPFRAKEELQGEMARYLSLANFHILRGKFTMNEKGAVFFELVLEDIMIKESIEDAMDMAFAMCRGTVDDYVKGFYLLLLGVKKADEAFQETQKTEDPPAPPPEDPPPPPPPPKSGETDTEAPSLFDTLSFDPEPKCEPESESEKKKGEKKPKDLSRYSLKGLNLTTPVPLTEIVSAVKDFRSGKLRADVDAPRLNVLISGAPGTGKTAFVKCLAKEVGAPLHTVKASDLIGRYTGETEKAIARVFRKAKEEDAILFLDEIDSFLYDRQFADKSWEVSQVNELLQQMEEFAGVMVGATNFADRLDKAVQRRFTYKLKLDYLTDEGKGVFFKRYFKTPLSDEERTRLQAIPNLTPGDFRTVREELYYLKGRQTNAARLKALEAESAAKGLVRAKIGF